MYIKQFELWATCYNNCDFCFNADGAKMVNVERQKQALLYVLDEIEKVFKEHEAPISISLIGGDFFQGQLNDPEVYALFFKLMNRLHELGEEDKIQQVCLFVTLTIGDQHDLYKALSVLKPDPTNKLDVWVSTSYDTKGRFNAPGKLENWQFHMKKLAGLGTVRLNTTLILSQDCLDKILSGELDLSKFQDEYHTTLFFKQPVAQRRMMTEAEEKTDPAGLYKKMKEEFHSQYPWFMPKRADMLKVLIKLKNLGILDRLMGLEYRADELYNHYTQNQKWSVATRDKEHNTEGDASTANKCGHQYIYQCYIDSDACILCDRDNIDE